MGSALKLLACKQGLSTAVNTIGVTTDVSPTSTAAKGWLIKTVFFYNFGTAGQNVTVDLKLKKGTGGGYRMIKANISVPPTSSGLAGTAATPVSINQEIALDRNVPEILAAVVRSASGTPSVDCIVTGVEHDQ